MRLALIADEYVPARTAVAVQMRGLAQELKRQGHEPTVIVPAADLDARWAMETVDGVEVLRLRAPRSKNVGHVRRFFAELRLPHALRRGLSTSPLAATKWDGIAWYSPSIFFGPLIRRLKRRHKCRSYLILRDLFPDWAVDTGVMRRGPAYYILKSIEHGQYRAADVIGVQTPANLEHLRSRIRPDRQRLEVLHNWLAPLREKPDTELAVFSELEGKTVFIYAGNMGHAQGMDCMIELAASLRHHTDALFLFVGRGTELPRLKELVATRALDNVIFHDEVEPWELLGLLARCHVGLLALDPRHTTHNIPGKFLTYLNAGLPVLARVNRGNDLVGLIDEHSVGLVCTGATEQDLRANAERLLSDVGLRREMGRRGAQLAAEMFRVNRAVHQIVTALQPGD